MIDTREFPSCAVASLSTGVLLVEPFSVMAELAEYILGRPIWTHQYPALADDLRDAVLRQFPDMPTDASGVDRSNWRAFAADIEGTFGPTLQVRSGRQEQ